MLVIRDLRSADLGVVRPWFTDPETRRWLGDSRWPEQILRLAAEDPGRHALAAVEDGVVVAIIDAERYGDGRVSVALIVAPGRRCQGLATSLMHVLADRPELNGLTEVFVGVEEGNTASSRLAIAAGFRQTADGPDEEGFVSYARPLGGPPSDRPQTRRRRSDGSAAPRGQDPLAR